MVATVATIGADMAMRAIHDGRLDVAP